MISITRRPWIGCDPPRTNKESNYESGQSRHHDANDAPRGFG